MTGRVKKRVMLLVGAVVLAGDRFCSVTAGGDQYFETALAKRGFHQ